MIAKTVSVRLESHIQPSAFPLPHSFSSPSLQPSLHFRLQEQCAIAGEVPPWTLSEQQVDMLRSSQQALSGLEGGGSKYIGGDGGEGGGRRREGGEGERWEYGGRDRERGRREKEGVL